MNHFKVDIELFDDMIRFVSVDLTLFVSYD